MVTVSQCDDTQQDADGTDDDINQYILAVERNVTAGKKYKHRNNECSIP